ncbi:MAG: peptidase MA family metallohydrolase [Anaerolineales bacterium]|nr:peptidase MA family metallohydrolase [Anaerolineales bacterium]
MRTRLTILSLYLMGVILTPAHASAAPLADVQNDRVTLAFPNTATFSATLNASSTITSVTLEYGNEQQTCGDVIAKSYPQFTPAASVNISWTWDMRQSGSLPPGATLWWRWRYTDQSGAEFVSQTQTATWLDDEHDWQTLTGEDLRLHYYELDAPFAQTMLDAGLEGLRRNQEQAGLETDDPIDVYVYPNYDDLRDAILYEPAWTGGLAYSDFNIVIMGVSGSNSTWDQATIIHELTHVLVGHYAFSCIGTIPTWLNEGLAMYSEGELDASMRSMLDQSIRGNTLISLRSLNGSFSELPEKANLSYAQSQSVVKFLIDTHGQEKISQLLIALRDAKPIDTALREMYGFDTDGLEDAWRKSINAAPRPVSAQATAQPTPTFVPTYVPISGAPQAVTPTPYVIPTSSFDDSAPIGEQTGPPLTLTISLLCFCLLFLLIIGVIVLGFIVRKDNYKAVKEQAGKHE